MGDRTQAAPILDIAATSDGSWSRTLAIHIRAAEAGDVALLEDAANAFVDQGALLLAAEAFAEASVAARGRGLKLKAEAAWRRSAELREQCGPVRTPVLVDAESPSRLTSREKEVVDLAARGLTNAEIAARLFVSVRTTEGHLLRAFAKLGVSDRAELREALAPDRS